MRCVGLKVCKLPLHRRESIPEQAFFLCAERQHAARPRRAEKAELLQKTRVAKYFRHERFREEQTRTIEARLQAPFTHLPRQTESHHAGCYQTLLAVNQNFTASTSNKQHIQRM